MGGYTYEKPKSDLKAEGQYEATLEKIEKKRFEQSGKEKIGLTWRIRSDVDQKYQNGVVFEDIWRDKNDPTTYNKTRINQLLGTQDIPEGTTFNSDESLIEFLTGINAIINVKIVHDDYNDKDVNRISFYRSTQIKPQTLQETNSQLDSNEYFANYELEPDDLPF